ncbi:MAG TPA: pilus assembly protein TadG-related protein [Dehalococcoidia bacterium]|nr:pilus assembly protein TadG-related protein [Dehalococcoidia bacterium]
MPRFISLRDRGQVLLAVALLIPVLLGMTAIAVDIGSYADNKRELQNDADAIALAAAQNLCTPNPMDCSSTTSAQSAADDYATKNNIDTSKVTVTFDNIAVTPTGNPTARVSISEDHKFAFARVLGISSKGVSARAAAVKTSPGGVAGITPWAVLDPPPASGTNVTLKWDSSNPSNGNFQAIQVDLGSGSGAKTYQDTISYGSSSIICAEGVTTCTNTSPVCPDYDQCPPETGNMTSSTKDGVNFLLNNTSTTCDTFAEAFSGPDAFGTYTLNPNCNPWAGPGACPMSNPETSPYAQCSRRVLILPIINGFGSGSSTPVTVKSFGLFWLQGFENGVCTGSNCNIIGTFVKADVTIGALAGVYDGASSIHYTRLTE